MSYGENLPSKERNDLYNSPPGPVSPAVVLLSSDALSSSVCVRVYGKRHGVRLRKTHSRLQGSGSPCVILQCPPRPPKIASRIKIEASFYKLLFLISNRNLSGVLSLTPSGMGPRTEACVFNSLMWLCRYSLNYLPVLYVGGGGVFTR